MNTTTFLQQYAAVDSLLSTFSSPTLPVPKETLDELTNTITGLAESILTKPMSGTTYQLCKQLAGICRELTALANQVDEKRDNSTNKITPLQKKLSETFQDIFKEFAGTIKIPFSLYTRVFGYSVNKPETLNIDIDHIIKHHREILIDWFNENLTNQLQLGVPERKKVFKACGEDITHLNAYLLTVQEWAYFILYCPKLTHVNLSNVHLPSSILDSLSSYAKTLKYLNLRSANFTGDFSGWRETFSQLEFLDLVRATYKPDNKSYETQTTLLPIVVEYFRLLPKLKHLAFGGSSYTNVLSSSSSFHYLTFLEVLEVVDIDDNMLKRLCPILLNLQRITIASDYVRTLEPLNRCLNLDGIDAIQCRFLETAVLPSLTKLHTFASNSKCLLTDVNLASPLLKVLKIALDDSARINLPKFLDALIYLDLKGSRPKLQSIVQRGYYVQCLNLKTNQEIDLRLIPCTHLQFLTVIGGSIVGIEALINFKRLRYLSLKLTGNKSQLDLHPLKDCQQIQILHLGGGEYQNVSLNCQLSTTSNSARYPGLFLRHCTSLEAYQEKLEKLEMMSKDLITSDLWVSPHMHQTKEKNRGSDEID